MATYLVTGGAGFIGSHITEALLRRGAHVRVLDNLATGRAINLDPFRSEIEWIEADIRDADAVMRAAKGADVVIHQAALPSVQRSVLDPHTSNAVNVTGTLNVLSAAQAGGARRVVFASSSSVYGDTPTLPKVESMPPSPRSPYAVSKLAGERYCLVWAEVYRVPAIALRYFNVFGPRQDPRSDYAAVIPRFATALLAGQAPTIYGDGEQSRDFTYVDNVVSANLTAADAPAEISGAFNVATGDRISLLDLVARLNRLIGSDIQPLHAPARAGDVRHSQAGIEAIRAAIGWQPVVAFDEGLRRTVEHFRHG
ncbi:MAG: SDR family oxidoreductase [Roseiflexaceae bacterium]